MLKYQSSHPRAPRYLGMTIFLVSSMVVDSAGQAYRVRFWFCAGRTARELPPPPERERDLPPDEPEFDAGRGWCW